MRDLYNRYMWTLPESLPSKASDDVLAAEPHSFSRIFSGACYEIMLRIWEKLKAADGSASSVKQLQQAALKMGSYLVTAASLAPVNERFYDCVAKAMIFVDIQHGEVHKDILYSVYYNRRILQPVPVKSQSSEDDSTFKEKRHSASVADGVVKQKNETINLGNTIHMQSIDEFSDLNVDVAMDHFQVDDHPELTIFSEKDAVLDSAHACVRWVKDQKKHKGNQPQFAIKGGKLTRKHFSCCFCR